MKREKRHKKEEVKEGLHLTGKELEEFLKNREQDEMIDDHGSVIIGGRDKKPRLPEE